MLRLSVALFLVQAGFHGFTASIPLALARAGRPDPEIGALVGVAALVQIPAALIGGALIDRFGGLRLFVVGGLCYIGAAAILFISGVDPNSTAAVIVARMLQGVGFGLALPAGLSVVPRLVPAARRGVALATAGAAHNLTLVVLPPLSIAVLDAYGLDGVTVLVGGLVAGALALVLIRRLSPGESTASDLQPARRRFGFAYRRSWIAPLAVTVMFVVHWGVLIAYLPQRAELAGASIGLFFAADGLFVLLARVPAGWMADRVRPVWLVLAGIAITAFGVLLLFPAPTTPLLVASGTLTGVGAALIVQPLVLALSQRSSDADRGSAFALFSAAFAGAIALGTVGTAPLIDELGFEIILALTLVLLCLSALVALADGELRRRPAGVASRGIEPDIVQEPGTPIGP